MIHVQGPGGSPANDINISANPSGNGNNNLLLGRLSAQGYSSTYNNFTDASGNVTMWLLPDSAYTFSADTPTGSQFVSTNLSNVNVNSDVNVTIVLQFVHSAPITVLAMATQPDQAGTYDGPVNVTLTATFASDFNIASTFYILDGGVQETYNGIFTIAENGTHTVQYWSVDNLGVGELPQTTSFTINNNKTITSTALTSSPTPSIQGQTVTFTATINPVPDSGTILFKITVLTWKQQYQLIVTGKQPILLRLWYLGYTLLLLCIAEMTLLGQVPFLFQQKSKWRHTRNYIVLSNLRGH